MTPLVGAAELAALEPRPTLLDVRWRLGGPPGADEFAGGHVPGARYVDLATDLADPPGAGGRHPLPEPERFEAAMRRAGVDDGRPVVVYDDWSGLAAARAWWLLRHHGHDDVRVLDGGWSAWRAAGGEVAQGPEPAGEGTFTARPGRLPVVDADGVPAVGVLVDVRAAERYRGDVEPVDPVAGHIPGAVNLPATETLAPDGTLLPAEDLRVLFAGAGVTGDSDVTAYCGSGVNAAHALLAMEVAGIRGALYPGSWSGWVTDPERPVAR